MESKTIAQAHPDLASEEFLALPENASAYEAFKAQREHEGRVASQFRQKQSALEEKKIQLTSFNQLLDSIKSADFPGALMANTVNSPNGLLAMPRIAESFAGSFIIKTFEPQLRKLAAREVAEMEELFAKLVADNREMLKKLGLI